MMSVAAAKVTVALASMSWASMVAVRVAVPTTVELRRLWV